MTSMQLYHDETQFTSAQSRIVVEDNKIFQVIERTRDIHSLEQVDRIIENLTLEKGFVLDSDHNKYIVLRNSSDPETTYTLDMLGPSISKVTKKFLGCVE